MDWKVADLSILRSTPISLNVTVTLSEEEDEEEDDISDDAAAHTVTYSVVASYVCAARRVVLASFHMRETAF